MCCSDPLQVQTSAWLWWDLRRAVHKQKPANFNEAKRRRREEVGQISSTTIREPDEVRLLLKVIPQATESLGFSQDGTLVSLPHCESFFIKWRKGKSEREEGKSNEQGVKKRWKKNPVWEDKERESREGIICTCRKREVRTRKWDLGREGGGRMLEWRKRKREQLCLELTPPHRGASWADCMWNRGFDGCR